jgi:uncharacterized membrane protein
MTNSLLIELHGLYIISLSGIATSVGLFSNVILARVVLSFFPQALKQFPVLKPIVTGIFYSQIPTL